MPSTTLTLRFTLDGQPVEMDIRVPAEPVRPSEMIRVFQALTDVFVESAIRTVKAAGRSISCRAHCGACCRQLVAITETDAHHIKRFVDALPQPRRDEILARFAAARQRLEEAGLLDEVRNTRPSTTAAALPLIKRYFDLQIPCPFLEEESCSIYADRPVVCREYLVCSPAENCQNPMPGNIEGVKIPALVSAALSLLGHPTTSPPSSVRPWVPFILALEWANHNPDTTPPRPGPEILKEFFLELAKQSKQRP
jgi:Fe-S-cluster containining protein